MDALIWKAEGTYMKLRKYCHKCDDYLSCPIGHPKCKTLLGLHTALAWKASNKLKRIVAGDGQRSLNELYTILSIVSMHKTIYPRLFELVEMAYRDASKIVDRRLV